MWVWKISQHACGRFLRSSYNPTEWDWNPGFPHYSRGKTTDLGFVGHGSKTIEHITTILTSICTDVHEVLWMTFVLEWYRIYDVIASHPMLANSQTKFGKNDTSHKVN